MSTIASPRDPSAPFPRRTNSSIITPTSSSRPSLDIPASASGSPNPNTPSSSSTTAAPAQSKRANRAALREYYNLRAANSANSNKPLPSPPTVEITDHHHLDTTLLTSSSTSTANEPPASELDSAAFSPPAYVARLLETSTLADLLRAYARVLSEMRALDAEKKALVYDNYSKLIAATETIRRMRSATTAQQQPDILSSHGVGRGQGGGIGGGSGGDLPHGGGVEGGAEGDGGGGGVAGEGVVDGETDERKRKERERLREVAREVVHVPGRRGGREARREWEVPRRLLEKWRERGVGGDEVAALIEEGDAALRGGEGGRSEVASTVT
ncbi:hypothetical protein NEMBOFW57_003860 [Staphylotrichum longicolle]|uniref:Vacuolar protein sorting-associated protein 51 homolog n=1 Tax=Staphylotrichum longicolle TaxID=669026 RepID=A0AAD4F5E5_9PEZI|nr:hypothetical protein NEMBOFW57_003860 [Staphylotrichum longicolle]